MKHPSDTGHFESSITPDVVEEAVKAVDRHTNASNVTEMESLKAELELSLAKGRELMAKLTDEHEKMLRAVADLENYKKRAVKEKDELQKYGNEKLVLDFLPVLDNFERALEAAQGASDFESFRSGVEMIRRLFVDALGKHGVKSFSAKGQPFDPSRHEAMNAVETTEIPPNHVHSELLRGFTLNERLVRPALVVIARSPTAVGESGSAPGSDVGKAQSQ